MCLNSFNTHKTQHKSLFSSIPDKETEAQSEGNCPGLCGLSLHAGFQAAAQVLTILDSAVKTAWDD